MNRRNWEEETGPFSNMSSSNGGGYQFDVFLSFRGRDTRQGFTSHLYEALNRFGAITFMDNEDLPKGEEIKHLLHYMEKSQIFVPILSQNYGQSKWCLWEAAKMVEIWDQQKWRTIIPVFYRIDPCDVKDDGGLYQSAIMKLQDEGKLEVEEMQKCIDALKTIGSISGFSLKLGIDGDEAELVSRICERVQMLLSRVPFGVQPIGIDSQIGEVITMLEAQRNGVCIIGICGMGGIGKTTIAKAIYDKLFSAFNYNTSFIEDVSEMANRKGLPSIQEKLICDVFKKKIVSIDTVDEGRNIISRRLGGKRVLIILDNIVKLDQLKALLGDHICHRPEDLFGTGSKIIVTTRDKDVLLSYRIKEHQIYCPQELKPPWSLQLFHRHAFMHEPPSFELLKLAEEAAGIAGGLPLVLEIFGSAFAGLTTTKEWNAKLEKLSKSKPKDILEKLRWSYDGLDDDQQKCVFLDIACFFVGAKRNYVAYLWDDYSSRDTINVLQGRSLITIDDDDRFRMHDEIQEMGRRIASGEGNPHPCTNRLRCTDEKLIVSMNSEEKERVEGIILNMEEGCTETDMSTEEFVGMSKLRLLHLNFVNFQEREIDHFPKKLNWLRWRGCEMESVTFNGRSFRNLAILDLSGSNIHQLHLKNKLNRLKVLDLSHCSFMAATPDFACTPKLEKLFLDDCIVLNEIHESICHLTNLTNWSMRNCQSLEKLPQECLGDLPKLVELNLQGCQRLQSLPDFACTPNLEKLFLDDCNNLNEIHESICHLNKLTNWSMRNCGSLEKLPQKHLGDLPKLVELNLQGCQQLQSLPRLPSSLRKLFLQECKMLIVAHGFENLESIELLEMDGCEGINSTLMMTKLFQGKSFTCLEELSISGVREGAEFFFLVPLCSSVRPLLLEHLQIYGDSGSPSIVYIKVCIKDMDDNSLVYETILSASHNETDGDSCYSLPLSAYDVINLSLGISTPCSVWVSGIAGFRLKRVDVMLRSVNKWGGNYSKAIPADENFENLVEATDSRCGRFTLWYDVFLICIEEDVDTDFIDNLYKALEEHGICVFKAKEGGSERGKVEIQLNCIERSLICVPIISKHLSESKWLLDSIAKMVKCGKLIMPVYFQVWPSDIKALTVTEDFGTYLYSYENENQREIVEDRKKSLEVVVEGCHHGFVYHTDRCMHELSYAISDQISSMLNFIMPRFRTPPTWVCSHGKHVQMILRDLEKETDSVCKICICGPNGIGKTTVAKIIYDNLFHKFEYKGFIADVGATARTSKGIMSLQQRLLSVVARDDNACIKTADHGKDLIKQRLGHKRVLIVFDDVDEPYDWEGECIFASDLFGGGSKIIVIAKAKEKPDLRRTSLDAIYYVDKLTDKKSFQLFAWHAFEGRQPTLELMELAREATKFAEGVPLCLAVLGSLFSSMTAKSEWGSILEKLASAQGNKCIDKIVKVSIDTLNIEQRQVLFDIACLKKHTTSVWKEHRYSPNNIIKFLQERCLISLDSENRPMMHDAIQDSSGTWLAQEVYNRPRPKSIGGLTLTRQNPHLRNVFLDIACCLVGHEKEYATYVWEDMGYSPNNAIKHLQDMSLISIDSEGTLQMDGLVQNVGRLMAKEGEHNPYMYITTWNDHGLSDPPQNTELRWLQVNDCYVDERVLDVAASCFEKLLVLQLYNCEMSVTRDHGLSNMVFKKLKVLEVLDHRLSRIETFGKTFGIEKFGIANFDFSRMPSLVKLVIEGYRGSLKTNYFDIRIGELMNLTYLRIRNCDGLEKLCDGIRNLSSLQTLDLQECRKLSELPKDLGDLKALRELILRYCESLIEIPNSIIKLDHLQTLDISDCWRLQHMPQLPSHLITLDASSCTFLRTIADVSKLQDLKTLKLNGCTKLHSVPGLQNLKSLQSMQLPFHM